MVPRAVDCARGDAPAAAAGAAAAAAAADEAGARVELEERLGERRRWWVEAVRAKADAVVAANRAALQRNPRGVSSGASATAATASASASATSLSLENSAHETTRLAYVGSRPPTHATHATTSRVTPPSQQTMAEGLAYVPWTTRDEPRAGFMELVKELWEPPQPLTWTDEADEELIFETVSRLGKSAEVVEALSRVTGLDQADVHSTFSEVSKTHGPTGHTTASYAALPLGLRDSSDPATHTRAFRRWFCPRCLKFGCGLHALPHPTKRARRDPPHQAPSSVSLPASAAHQAVAKRIVHVFRVELGNDKPALEQALAIARRVGVETLVRIMWSRWVPLSTTATATTTPLPETSTALQCDHDGPCDAAHGCACALRGRPCEALCACEGCSRKWRGCKCTSVSECTWGTSCRCRRSRRECDPDVCGKCCSSDARPHSGPHILVGPHALQLHKRKRLRVGVSSDVRGWGVFAGEPIAKDTLVGEYVGEAIPPPEADARGAVYDDRDHSFLFQLSSDVVLDATRVGNKTRWMNHASSSSPACTCVPRVVSVRGENHILMFAKRDVASGEELTFDYGPVGPSSSSRRGPGMRRSLPSSSPPPLDSEAP